MERLHGCAHRTTCENHIVNQQHLPVFQVAGERGRLRQARTDPLEIIAMKGRVN
jgi:hypothetical protein